MTSPLPKAISDLHKTTKDLRSYYFKAGSISVRLSAVKIVARVHFRGITAACVSITGEIIVAHPPIRRRGATKLRQTLLPMARRAFAPNLGSL
jgi:hypothetical protein